MTSFLVLGCGYTGKRVARRLLSRGERVLVTAHGADGLEELRRLGARVQFLEAADERSLRDLAGVASSDVRLRVLCSIPLLRREGGLRDATGDLLRALGAHTDRVVYLSTTSVYGDAEDVDEHTAAVPRDEAGRLRLASERAAADGPWPALVLRTAAIYGPGRGVQVALRAGTAGRVRDVDRVVSRVHVDDLAALAEAALLSDAAGTYPVADDEPATTRAVAAYCERLGLPALRAPAVPAADRARGRRVDGRAVRALLSVRFQHPTYRTGLAAALEEERSCFEMAWATPYPVRSR